MNATTRRLALFAAFAAAPALAQGASSATHALGQHTLAGGGRAQTSQFVLQSTLGPSPTASIAFSSTFALHGGFVGGLAVPVGPTPYLTGVLPRFATMRGAAALTVHGTGLIAGTAPSLTIGGVPAAIGTRTNAQVTTALPHQPAPGWQPVTFQSAGNTTTLARGIGVLPLLEMEPALGVGVPADIVFRGRTGDAMIFCLANFALPFAVPIAGLGHGLGIDPVSLIPSGLLVVTDPGGERRLRIPALATAATMYLQAATLSSDPGYAPGSFTNVMRVF